MKINFDRLIGTVQEHFENERSYITECKKKDWWKRSADEKNHISWLERTQQGSSNAVGDICGILDIDCGKIYIIARAARKWEQKHNWERCFPTQDHEKQIAKYLSTKTNEIPHTEIEYLHWKINNHRANEA